MPSTESAPVAKSNPAPRPARPLAPTPRLPAGVGTPPLWRRPPQRDDGAGSLAGVDSGAGTSAGCVATVSLFLPLNS
jgi:hypothetical protein